MASCLIALGSNLGDRAATLRAAVAMLAAESGVELRRCSSWHPTQPLGVSGCQHEFLNGAAHCDTEHLAEDFLKILQRIESEHGRKQRERWADRTLDLDLLLYGQQTIDTPTVTVPHPRMSFRRFVLEPAIEIAGHWVHPTIGWTLDELLYHLDHGADCFAIVSTHEPIRRELAESLVARCGVASVGPPVDDPRWPAAWTNWLAVPAGNNGSSQRTAEVYAAARHPKLTFLLDPPGWNEGAWTEVAQQTGRGPTLRLSASAGSVVQETLAAVEAVWPHLGPFSRERLQ